MPDGALAKSLIGTAKRLVPASSTKPTQANLRRCISTSYYAVFHALAKACADGLVGATKSRRPNKAWVEVYRGLEHGISKNACRGAGNIDFPQKLKDFADAFIQLQDARQAADYDPVVRPNKENALFFISLAEQSIEAINSVSLTDKRAFATWVLISSRGAQDARKRARDGHYRGMPGR